MSAKRILFVCTGNSCRSVMAQGMTQQMLHQAGLRSVQVESAGVFAVEGMAPTRETLRVLQDVGVDSSAHRARSLTVQMAQDADLILAMEAFQVEEIIRRIPSVREKVHLLKAYGLPAREEMPSLNIPDPIGKPLEVYEVCFAEIHEAVERVVKSLGVRSA